MTDATLSALASPVARQSHSSSRAALASDDEQADFGNALAEAKEQPQPEKGKLDNAALRDLRKLAERLAAQDTQEKPKDDVPPEANAAGDKQVPLPDVPQGTRQAEPDPAHGPALPLVIALSELRKAGSQAGGSQSSDGAADADNPDIAAPRPGGDRATNQFASISARSAVAGSALQPVAAGPEEAKPMSEASETAPNARPNIVGENTGEAERNRQAPQPRQADQAPVAARVSVVAEQAIPAPAQPLANTTAGALALAIASDAPHSASAAAAMQQALNNNSGTSAAHVLKIQLKPVELGTVTASLHLSGEQLTVEIEVENAEAYHRLSADREALTSALRGLGFDVDRLTIQQPQPGTNASARGDGTATSSGRDQSAFQSGGPGGEGGGSGSGQSGRGAANEDGNARNGSAPRPDRAGSSLYI